MTISYEKSNSDIADQWDAVAAERHSQLVSGVDRTYANVMVPLFIDAVAGRGFSRALDAGCGTGHLTAAIADHVPDVTGVDLSPKSIRIANEHYARPGLRFQAASITAFDGSDFDLCIASMFIMDCNDLPGVLASIRDRLTPGGRFYLTMPNPYVMPRHWDFEDEHWFDYLTPRQVQTSVFRRFTTEAPKFKTTYMHRPLGDYFTAFLNAGFQLEAFQEIKGDPVTKPGVSKYPRHLFIKLISPGRA